MKRILFMLALAMTALGFTSCNDSSEDYLVFVGTWGVERIDYYNIDYWGNPIESSMKTYYFTPGDSLNGIDLVFRSDKSGEMRDRSRDTLYIPVYDEDNVVVDTNVIVCPDTVLVTGFNYSYHKDDALYMTMDVTHPFTYKMEIPNIDKNSFTYINEYDNDYVERAKLVRISDNTKATTRRRDLESISRPYRRGSLLSNY